MNVNFPDLLGFSQRTRSTSLLKAQLQTVSQEAVTGLQADFTKASRGRVGDVHLLQKALADITVETRVNSLASSRVALISQGISGARAAIDGLDTLAIVALNSNGAAGINAVSDQARASLDSVMSSLSAKHGSRNLFSGDAVDRPTFASAETLVADVQQILSNAATANDAEIALNAYFNDPAGGFNTSIYTGGTGDASGIRLGNDEHIPQDIKGNDTAIKDVLRGLAVMAAATQSGLDTTSDTFENIFSSAITKTANGNFGLITLETGSGIHAETIEKLNERNQAETVTLTAAYQAIVGRDQFEAASELKLLEVALESSYILTSRLSSLSLVNYLR